MLLCVFKKKKKTNKCIFTCLIAAAVHLPMLGGRRLRKTQTKHIATRAVLCRTLSEGEKVQQTSKWGILDEVEIYCSNLKNR